MQALPTGWVMEQFLTYQFLIEVNASWSVETEWGYVNLYQSLIEVNARCYQKMLNGHERYVSIPYRG